MPDFKSRALRFSVGALAFAALSACASFDFDRSGGDSVGAAGGGHGGTQVIAMQLMLVPAENWSSVLNNQTGQRLRVFATLLGEGPLDLRLASTAAANCSAADTLSRRGQSSVLALDKGCTLQAQSRGSQPSLLRVQTEGPKLDP